MSTRGDPIRLATRGSALALTQARLVRDRLADRRIAVDLVEVETTGDEIQDELIHELGTTGAFVRSLDRQVLDGDVDAAVHSMKDMPTDQPESLVVAGIPDRGPAHDVLVTPDGTALAELPAGATVGTASLRRQAQLLAERPDLTVSGLRGNVDTRVEKLLAPTVQAEYRARQEAAGGAEDESGAGDGSVDSDTQDGQADGTDDSGEYGTDDSGEYGTDDSGEYGTDDYDSKDYDSDDGVSPAEWVAGLTDIERGALDRSVDTAYDAICLAEAGLDRSGLLQSLATERLEPQSFVPAPAQGTIAVTALDGELAERIHDVLDHPPTRVEVTVERTVLGELGGGCVAPVGIHARLQGEVVTTTARICSRDGTEEVGATRELPVQRHGEAAIEFARDLAAEGARDLISAARREEPDEAKRR